PVARLHFVPARSRRSCERRRKGRGSYVRCELPHGDLSENTHPLGPMIIEMSAGIDAALAIGRWLQGQNANRVDVTVLIKTDIAALIVKVQGHAIAVTGERIQAAPRIVSTGIIRGDFAFSHFTVRKTLAFVETRRAHESKRRAFWQTFGERAIVRERRKTFWLS